MFVDSNINRLFVYSFFKIYLTSARFSLNQKFNIISYVFRFGNSEFQYHFFKLTHFLLTQSQNLINNNMFFFTFFYNLPTQYTNNVW